VTSNDSNNISNSIDTNLEGKNTSYHFARYCYTTDINEDLICHRDLWCLVCTKPRINDKFMSYVEIMCAKRLFIIRTRSQSWHFTKPSSAVLNVYSVLLLTILALVSDRPRRAVQFVSRVQQGRRLFHRCVTSSTRCQFYPQLILTIKSTCNVLNVIMIEQ